MGTRPVTLCTAQWADVPFDELCVLAKKMGYDGLEVACWGEGIDIDIHLRRENRSRAIDRWPSASASTAPSSRGCRTPALTMRN